jgi:hypothetical protein
MNTAAPLLGAIDGVTPVLLVEQGVQNAFGALTGSVSYRVSRARSAGLIGCATVDGARYDLTGRHVLPSPVIL